MHRWCGHRSSPDRCGRRARSTEAAAPSRPVPLRIRSCGAEGCGTRGEGLRTHCAEGPPARRAEGLRARGGRLPGLRAGGHRPDGGPLALAGRCGAAGGAHLPAGRRLVEHRGAARLPQPLGEVAARQARPDVRAQRAHAGAQRGQSVGRRGPGPHRPGRPGRLRRPLPQAGHPAGAAGGPRHGDRAGLGDERHHLHPALRPRPAGLEDVLEADRHRDALRPRPEVQVRLHAQPRPGRHPLDAVLPGRPHGGHRGDGLVRPATGRHLRGSGEGSVRAPGAGRLRDRAQEADLLPRVGSLQERRRHRLHARDAGLVRRAQTALPDHHGLLPARCVAVRREPRRVEDLPDRGVPGDRAGAGHRTEHRTEHGAEADRAGADGAGADGWEAVVRPDRPGQVGQPWFKPRKICWTLPKD